MTNKKPQYVAVYCQHCGYIDYNVSTIAIDVIRRMAQTEEATITCKACKNQTHINFLTDTLKIRKNGKVKLPETTQW